MPPVAGLHDSSLTATFLIFIGLMDSAVLVWNGCELPGSALMLRLGLSILPRTGQIGLGALELNYCLNG